ncbi:unnamed protein product [Dracunculus medinensis]|uniref:WD_REPEATS_REGION domain-containing protein n=1 Tax=Dracunculus medinensis TaxID=318479 RepID=A0A3P7SRZ8_DRAME|nr:unnamed protein product [Dracunculus medinensis]
MRKSFLFFFRLFSLLVGSTWKNIRLIAGTVFGEILISYPSKSPEIGMIFGLVLRNNHLFSISDDRSLRIWCLRKNLHLDCAYGHSSRPFAICTGPSNSIITGSQVSCALRLINRVSLFHNSMEWPCKFIVHLGRLYIAGFHGSHCVFEVDCGGGHRLWQISFDENNRNSTAVVVNFEFIRKGRIERINSYLYTLEIIQNNLHTSGITSVAVLSLDNKNVFIATGGVDTISLSSSKFQSITYQGIFCFSLIRLLIVKYKGDFIIS